MEKKHLLQKIRKCTEREPEVAKALETLKAAPVQLRRGIEEWNVEDGLVLFRGLVYVPNDKEIRREILELFHDSPPAGHPGRAKTLELISRNYWWPSMTKYVHDYVDGCDRCKQTKVLPSRPTGPLQPNEVPEGPWQTITCDLIVDLPKSEGCDSIFVVVDRFSKQAHFIPTTKDVDSKGISELFLKNVWKHHGTPKKVISDRGTQFISKFMGQMSKRLGTKWSASTSYHPRTDGQTERVNQEVEQYLRMFTSYRQNDWVSWLPIAEFSHNNAVTVTGHSPFKVLYGYNPDFTIHPNSMSVIPAADERVDQMKEARDDAENTLKMVNERMKRFYDKGVKEAPQYKIGDKVWLDAKNLKQRRPSQKLSDRRLGPFEILEKIGEVNYKLKLPEKYQIHPVFHVELLTPYHASRLIPHPPPNRPPPELIDDREEFAVEEVLDSRLFRGKLQYLVKWEGYPKEESSWEPEENLKNAPIPLAEFHKKNPTAAAGKYRRIKGSVLFTEDFKRWREKNIRPSFVRDDTHLREGVMSRVPLTNHYSFLNLPKRQYTAPKSNPNPTLKASIIPEIPLAPTTRVFDVTDEEDEFFDCE